MQSGLLLCEIHIRAFLATLANCAFPTIYPKAISRERLRSVSLLGRRAAGHQQTSNVVQSCNSERILGLEEKGECSCVYDVSYLKRELFVRIKFLVHILACLINIASIKAHLLRTYVGSMRIRNILKLLLRARTPP